MPYRKFQPDVQLKTDSKICNQRFRLVKSYIFSNIEGPIQSVELAEMLGISPWYFSRLFHHYTGVTVTNYIVMWRLNIAKDMLQNSNRSLVDISIACGFSSQSHLQSAFKRMVGMTPNKWRLNGAGQQKLDGASKPPGPKQQASTGSIARQSSVRRPKQQPDP